MERMEKQTAVDILYKFLYEMESFEGFDPYSFNHKDVFNKAKEMEKQKMIDFANEYGTYLLQGGTMTAGTYNETFK
jgi:hypothetical protein